MSLVFLALLTLALLVALLPGRRAVGTEEFFIASGRLGAAMFFFLSVGETYSIATILGVPAGVRAHGTGFLEWFLGYILLAFPVGYFMYPCIWRAGRRTGALTLPDLFRRHFDSRMLELVVALTSLGFLVPLGVLQFVGLGTVLSALGWALPTPVLNGGAGLLVLAMVAGPGIRAQARVAVVKDLLMLLSVLLVGAAAIALLSAAPRLPAPLPIPVAVATASRWPVDLFAMSTIVLQAVGFCLVPQTVTAVFTARSVRSLRRAQIAMPLYLLMFPLLVAVAGASGLLPAASRGGPNDVLVTVARTLLPAWGFGLVLAGAALSALVILGGICLSLGPLVSRNLVPGLDGLAQRRFARVVMAVYLLLSIAGAARFHGLMVSINNVFYFGIPQTLPALMSMLALRRVRPLVLAIGLLFGDAVAIGLHVCGVTLCGMNPGLIGLAANAGLVWLLSRPNDIKTA